MLKQVISSILLLGVQSAGAQENKKYTMWNPALLIEQRVNDVVSRLTLQEKVARMLNTTPAIAPIRALKGFQRVFLKAGETKTIGFTLNAEDLSLVREDDGTLYQPTGKVMISVGGGQPGMPLTTTSNMVTETIRIE